MFYGCVLTTEKYIYALYSGRTREEEGTESYEANDILLYDWEGNPVVNYKTDRFIRNIKYDEDEEIFYSYIVNSETGLPEIFTFELPVR